ncbi:MAG: UDP-N-acetylglucosamine 1-carboxyvinyltransferase [Candidatus Bostrichicola ureolyticus]|nr:MAG: UDP-N-acetylglucosamine 1-carboxyvinyltransferase [Candidatus Bostrichicola ureolyticus]
MEKFKIIGGRSLKGEVIPQGSKNEALQVLCAVLLTSDKISIKNIPNIRDIKCLISIFKYLGVDIISNNKNHYTFQAKNINFDFFNTKIFLKKSSKIRGSIMIAGPILGRFGKAIMPIPGGDKIGIRHIDTHIKGFIDLGVNITYKNKVYVLNTNNNNLVGKYLILEEQSITATANILMASVLAKGKTTIFNAACEPYIQQLCKMLINMGAIIKGVGSNLLNIIGVNRLNGCEHSIMPDIIEIGSWIGLAAITNSEIIIKNICYKNLGIITNTFKKLGIKLEEHNNYIYIPSQGNYSIKKFMDGSMLTIYDAPWPGLTPDLLSIILVVATQANGSILIHQKMFESRLFFVDKLIDMGAKIILCDPHRAIVMGLDKKYPLRGSSLLSAPDIRSGISLLIAALSAKGCSIISNIEQIERGYENIDQRLRILGASISRIK